MQMETLSEKPKRQLRRPPLLGECACLDVCVCHVITTDVLHSSLLRVSRNNRGCTSFFSPVCVSDLLHSRCLSLIIITDLLRSPLLRRSGNDHGFTSFSKPVHVSELPRTFLILVAYTHFVITTDWLYSHPLASLEPHAKHLEHNTSTEL